MILMRRLSVVLALVLVAASATAITTPHPPRMALLDLAPRYEMRVDAFGAMRDSLKAALERHGFDAYTTADHYEDLARFKSGNADYYLEIIGSEREAHSRGGGGVGVGPVDVGVTAVKNRHFLALRVYDGYTLDVIRTYEIDAATTSLVPSLLGIRGYNFFMSLFVAPWGDHHQAQRTIDAVAREAASRITRDMTQDITGHQQRR
jgi:hypothetical protein